MNTLLSDCIFFRCRSMAPPAQPNFALKSILEKDKLNGTNFTTWYRNLRIVLKHDKKEHVLEDPLPEEPADNANTTTRNAYQKLVDESNEISCLMLACMEPDLQQHFENVEAYDMIESLKSMFQTQARTERFNVWRSLMDCKLMSWLLMLFWVLFCPAMGRSSRTIICMAWIRSSLNCMGCSKWQSRILRKAHIKC